MNQVVISHESGINATWISSYNKRKKNTRNKGKEKLPCSKGALKTEQNALGLGSKCTPTIRKSVIVFMQEFNFGIHNSVASNAATALPAYLSVRPNPNYRNVRSDSMRTNVRNKRLLYRGIEFAVAGPPLPLYMYYICIYNRSMPLRGTGWNTHSVYCLAKICTSC
jgi:hypothetical protein